MKKTVKTQDKVNNPNVEVTKKEVDEQMELDTLRDELSKARKENSMLKAQLVRWKDLNEVKAEKLSKHSKYILKGNVKHEGIIYKKGQEIKSPDLVELFLEIGALDPK